MMFIILLTVLAPTFVFADSKTIESIWKRKDQMERCREYQNEIKSWWTDDEKSDARVVSKDKIDRAIGILDQVHYPTTEDVDLIQASLKNNFGNTYLKWIGIAGADCPQVRVSLIKALINTTKANPREKALIETKVRSTLAANKYPTLLNVSTDSFLVEYGLSHGIWKKGSTPGLSPEISKLRASLKQEAQKWRKEYNSIFEKSVGSIKDDSPESVANFKSLKEFDKIKMGAMEEKAATEKYYKELHGIISKLN